MTDCSSLKKKKKERKSHLNLISSGHSVEDVVLRSFEKCPGQAVSPDHRLLSLSSSELMVHPGRTCHPRGHFVEAVTSKSRSCDVTSPL